jgi:hypothetical protein
MQSQNGDIKVEFTQSMQGKPKIAGSEIEMHEFFSRKFRLCHFRNIVRRIKNCVFLLKIQMKATENCSYLPQERNTKEKGVNLDRNSIKNNERCKEVWKEIFRKLRKFESGRRRKIFRQIFRQHFAGTKNSL